MEHQVFDAPAEGRPQGRRRRMLRMAVVPAGLLVLQACGRLAMERRPAGETGPGGAGIPAGPAGAGTGVPVRDEPSAAEIRSDEAWASGGRNGAFGRNESLLDTYWKLIELGGAPVAAHQNQREPHLILYRTDRRASAHGGCNRLTGTYSLARDRLVFGRLVSTRMACTWGVSYEAGLSAALSACAAWRVEGPILELLDAAGSRVARFEVRHL